MALTLAFLAGAALAADEGWLIERLDIQLAIQRDGSIAAHEAIDVDFRGLERHGIFRDIVALVDYDGTSNAQALSHRRSRSHRLE